MRVALVALFTVFVCAADVAAQPRVEITAIMQGTLSPTAPQQWNRALGEAGFDRATIRSRRVNDELGIENAGTERNPVYRVTALLSGDTLVLPPRSRFSRRDVSGIARWLQDLKDNGPEVATSTKTAFGLSPKQLEAVNDDLKSPVTVATQGAAPVDVVNRLARGLKHTLTFDAGSQRVLAADAAVRDELRGVSTGTALAAILRPAGLVLHPRSRPGRVELAVVESRQRMANWPIGWDSKQSPGKAIPALFESEETQEVELPLQTALNELSKRTRTPFLLDHNGMAVRRISAETSVSMREGRSHFGSILSHLLRQVGMQYEVRVDENSKPFLWLSAGR